MNATAQRIAVCLLFVLTVLAPCAAAAHGTKGRVKMDLDKDKPTVDDFAYFVEGYVGSRMFAGVEGPTDNRFVVKDFEGIELHGGSAIIRLIVLDKNGSREFPESMRFTRSEDGVWMYAPPDGKPIPVHTFVPKTYYHYRTYVRPMAWMGLAVGLAALAASVRKRVLKRRELGAPGSPAREA